MASAPEGYKNPRGWNAAHEQGMVYVFLNSEFRIYSQDEGDDMMRFGVISFFVKQQDRALAVTLFQLFSKRWDPAVPGSEDPLEPVVGKVATRFRFANPDVRPGKAADKSLIRDSSEFGAVVSATHPFVMISVHPSIASSEEFLNNGVWMKAAA
jgi:hypothetical protein